VEAPDGRLIGQKTVKQLFAQVLTQWYALGIIGGDLFAIDGCKLPSKKEAEKRGKA
jgi:hypothetical protein